MQRITLDLSRYPLVMTRLPAVLVEAELEDYLERFVSEVVARNTPFVSIVDARDLSEIPNATVRERLTEWQRTYKEADGRRLGLSIVTQRTLLRGVMSVIELVHRSSRPTTYHATMEQALAWAEPLVAKARA